nr:unnamed protein product [Digitaria exilis]
MPRLGAAESSSPTGRTREHIIFGSAARVADEHGVGVAPPRARPPLGVVHRPVLRVYDAPEQDDVLWVAVGSGDEGGDVLLRHDKQDTSFLGVTADSNDSRRTH